MGRANFECMTFSYVCHTTGKEGKWSLLQDYLGEFETSLGQLVSNMQITKP